MNALVTGASGFLGRHLLEELDKLDICKHIHAWLRKPRDLPHKNLDTYSQVDLLDTLSIAQEFEFAQVPHLVFHFAGNATIKDNQYIDNIKMTENFFSHFGSFINRQNNIRPTVVLASSAAVYGACEQPYRVRYDQVLKPSSLYGISKLACEEIAKYYQKQYDFNLIICRYVANVGKYATHGLFRDIIEKYRGPDKSISLYCDYDSHNERILSKKPFAHAQDTVKQTIAYAMRRTIDSLNSESKYSPDVVNISPDDALSLSSIIHIMESKFGKKHINWQQTWRGDDSQISVSPNLRTRPSKEAFETAMEEYLEENK